MAEKSHMAGASSVWSGVMEPSRGFGERAAQFFAPPPQDRGQDRVRTFAWTVFASACAMAVATSAEAGDADAGRRLAGEVCTACHLVSPGQTGPVIDGVPSFAALARNPSMTDDALRGFVLDPHPAMPQVQLSAIEIDSIVAYIRSLAP